MDSLFYCETAAQSCTLSLNGVLPAVQQEVFVLPQIEYETGCCITVQVPAVCSSWQFNVQAIRDIFVTVTNAVFRRAVRSVRSLAVACCRLYQSQFNTDRELLRLLKMARRLWHIVPMIWKKVNVSIEYNERFHLFSDFRAVLSSCWTDLKCWLIQSDLKNFCCKNKRYCFLVWQYRFFIPSPDKDWQWELGSGKKNLLNGSGWLYSIHMGWGLNKEYI